MLIFGLIFRYSLKIFTQLPQPFFVTTRSRPLFFSHATFYDSTNFVLRQPLARAINVFTVMVVNILVLKGRGLRGEWGWGEAERMRTGYISLQTHTVQPVLSKTLGIIKMYFLKTGACLIQVHFNVFDFLGK